MTKQESSREPLTGWRLPPFYCPLPSAIHPHAVALERQAIEWLDTFRLYRDGVDRAWSIATHSTDFSCRINPSGADGLLLLFIEWNHWAFALDDNHHDLRTPGARTAGVVDLSARICRCLEAPGSALLDPADPATAALADLAHRTRRATTPAQLRRISEGLRDWLLGAAWLVANEERQIMPTLSDYAAMRPAINGTRFSLAWSTAIQRIDLSDERYSAADVQAITEVAGFIVSCDNDLFSYAKDDDQALPEPNVINIGIQHHDCTPQEAIAEAVKLRDRCMTLYLNLREQLGRDHDPQLHRYLQAMDYYISGCLAWMNTAPRYASPRNRHRLPVEGASWNITMRDTPSDPSLIAPPIPGIRWWWQFV